MNDPEAPPASAKTPYAQQAGLAGNLWEFWLYLIRGRALNIALLLCLIVLAALMEMATLAAAMPLIGSLIDSQFSSSNFIANDLKLPGFITSARDPQALVLAAAVVIVCVSAAIRILVVRISTDFSAQAGIALQVQCFRYLINRDYEAVINESSSKSISLIANKIQMLISVYILGVLNTLTAVVSAVAVTVFLFWLSNIVVFIAIGVLAVAYLSIAWATRSRLKKYGKDLQTYIPQKVQYVQESFGGIRDVAMSGAQEVFTDKLRFAVEKVEKAVARVVFFGAFPRPIVEAIAISCVAGIALLAHQGYIESDNLLPVLGVFSLGILRLMPFVQQIFGQWTRIVNAQPILNELMQVIRCIDDQQKEPVNHSIDANLAPLMFKESIAVDNVSFSYVDVNKPAVQNITFSINKGEHIGIIGPTGSGKSTLVDILMGLLQPAAGSILIDGVVLDNTNRVQWQKQVAHVPQKIFLTDGSIENNIAFAIPADKIDMARVSHCARLACVEDFILSLPDQYATAVGENGVRLSGGQRQRIGIARALYSECSVLVLDEATSALDEITERQVIEGLSNKNQGYTIISITHNTALLNHCSRVLTIRDGQGSWRE